MKIRIYDETSGIFRSGDMDLFQGFGLKHNQRIDEDMLSPLMSQAIGEGIVFFGELLSYIMSGDDSMGDIRFDEDKYKFYLDLRIGKELHEARIISPKVGSYRALLYEDCIQIAAYDNRDRFIPSQIDFLKQYTKHVPLIAALLMVDTVLDDIFSKWMYEYATNPNKELLIAIYQYFCKKHKRDDYEVSYDSIMYTPFKDYQSLSKIFATERKLVEEKERDIELEQLKSQVIIFNKDAFKEEYKNLIPKLGPEYVFPEQMYSLSNAIAAGDIITVLFQGPSGTGKTSSCKLISQLIEMPIMEIVNCTEKLDEYILGKYVPEGDQILFKESYITKAIRDGGAVVFEEINFAKPQHLAFLNSLLDDNGFVRLDNGEIVRRHKNFRFFATMNLGYFGTKEMNQALFNRFQTVVELDELSDKAIEHMLVTKVPDCAGFVSQTLTIYHQIKDKIKREELSAVISARNLENWMRMCKYEAFEDAAEKTIIPIAKGDKELELDLRLMIKQCHWRE